MILVHLFNSCRQFLHRKSVVSSIQSYNFHSGLATNIESVMMIRKSFSRGIAMDKYINLYRNDGVPMSCHITLSFDTRSVHRNRTINENKITGMLTIVSACKYGNTLLLGDKPLDKYTRQEKIESIMMNK